MNKTLIAIAAGLLTLSALPAAALDASQDRGQPRQSQDRIDRNDRDGRGNANTNNGGRSNYGEWNARWGARPANPPRTWTRQSDWYRHVRACQVRYRSYDARTDRYVVRRGQTALCRL